VGFHRGAPLARKRSYMVVDGEELSQVERILKEAQRMSARGGVSCPVGTEGPQHRLLVGRTMATPTSG